jgi:hypothetical protein
VERHDFYDSPVSILKINVLHSKTQSDNMRGQRAMDSARSSIGVTVTWCFPWLSLGHVFGFVEKKMHLRVPKCVNQCSIWAMGCVDLGPRVPQNLLPCLRIHQSSPVQVIYSDTCSALARGQAGGKFLGTEPGLRKVGVLPLCVV